ncbi:hypothetical protein EJN92_13825 [Undibacterium parvum]|uniref:Uncharacterized protein n=3 Tax=Undibacterium TaxID=401469 RepID=A0A6M4A955_9BURK|nr:hypothetical protein EJN92_13825 [Undibacterium parvum]QJQ07801.1 hypothetical protein EJG51_016270 [Undibacterium piscinae]
MGLMLLTLWGPARADGLADLKSALSRLQGQSPLKATIELKSVRRLGEGKELEESSAHASLSVEDGARGMQVFYSKETLTRAETEARAKGKDPKSKTPTVTALSELSTAELRPMVAAALGLSRQIDEGIFKGEKFDTYNGKPARLLSFEFTMDRLSERERKYVKKMESTLDLWIAADGTPLASSFRQSGSGRAFVVVSFEQKYDEDSIYGLSGDRLLLMRRESRLSSSGAGEKMESKVVKTLQL